MAKKGWRSSTTEPVERLDDMGEPLRVYCWRHEELMRAGYPLQEATAIASRFDVDLHDAVNLLERGCAPRVAAEILL